MVNTANPFSQTMTSSGYESENALLCTEVKSAPIDGKGFVPDEIRTQIFRKLRTRQENRTCFGRNFFSRKLRTRQENRTCFGKNFQENHGGPQSGECLSTIVPLCQLHRTVLRRLVTKAIFRKNNKTKTFVLRYTHDEHENYS